MNQVRVACQRGDLWFHAFNRVTIVRLSEDDLPHLSGPILSLPHLKEVIVTYAAKDDSDEWLPESVRNLESLLANQRPNLVVDRRPIDVCLR